ncbi:ATP-binding cassette domain-containing protein [Levilactobacillus brevis]|uniref:ATP-binding cassette domain-containing protein n=1 Tax=Levilactobacillus brevis TaxID=1580 RepID=UPI00111BC750|nr:ABC transporter ATP-binding protein [Levilactobacillus brevis]QCZ47169.1 ABC transporter [Levilactobacillus brevis]
MGGISLTRLIKLREISGLLFGKLFLNNFNLFVSLMLQIGIGYALDRSPSKLWEILVVLIAGSIAYGFIYYGVSIIFTRVHQRTSQEVSERLIYKELNNRKSSSSFGKFVNLVSLDAQNVADFLESGIVPLIDFCMTLAFGLCYIFIISRVLGGFYLIIGVVMFCCAYYFYNQSLINRKKYQTEDDKQKGFFTEIFKNLPILQVFQLGEWANSRNRSLFFKKQSWFVKYSKAGATNMGIMSGGIYALEVVSLGLGLWLVNMGEISFGSMVGVWNAGIGSVFDSFLALPVTLAFLVDQRSSIKRINESISGIQDTNINEGWKNEVIKRIEFSGIKFKYEGKDRLVLDNLSGSIDPRKITFVVGENGAGKSTLFKILFGEISPQYGEISIITDKGKYDSLQGLAAYVPQDVELYSDTLRNNLTFGEKVPDEKLRQVLEESGASEIVSELDNGLDTFVSGSNMFSPGELRRIAIARALLTNQKLILMDEPFSDVDENNQVRLMHIFRKLSRDVGIIIITHTFNLVEKDDCLFTVGGKEYE